MGICPQNIVKYLDTLSVEGLKNNLVCVPNEPFVAKPNIHIQSDKRSYKQVEMW